MSGSLAAPSTSQAHWRNCADRRGLVSSLESYVDLVTTAKLPCSRDKVCSPSRVVSSTCCPRLLERPTPCHILSIVCLLQHTVQRRGLGCQHQWPCRRQQHRCAAAASSHVAGDSSITGAQVGRGAYLFSMAEFSKCLCPGAPGSPVQVSAR
jgi:hypothetical protein